MNIKTNIVARGVLIRGTKVLVAYCKGSSNTFLPGGQIEPGERSEDTLKRELSEELGLKISVNRFLGAVEQTFTENGKNHHGINLIFLIDSEDNLEQLNSKENHLDFFFIESKETGKMNLLPSPLQSFIEGLIHGRNEIWWNSDFKMSVD